MKVDEIKNSILKNELADIVEELEYLRYKVANLENYKSNKDPSRKKEGYVTDRLTDLYVRLQKIERKL